MRQMKRPNIGVPICALMRDLQGQRRCRAQLYSSMVLTHSQPPLSLSFHKLTLLSAVLTARTLPLRLQLTRQAFASTLRTVDFQSPVNMSRISACSSHPSISVSEIGCYLRRSDDVQMRIVLSWLADAMYDLESTVGDQATSRTQSVCPGRIWMLL